MAFCPYKPRRDSVSAIFFDPTNMGSIPDAILLPFVSQEEWEKKKEEVSVPANSNKKIRCFFVCLVNAICLGIGIYVILHGMQKTMQENYECTQPEGCTYSCCGSKDCNNFDFFESCSGTPAGDPEDCVYWNNQAQGSKFYPALDGAGTGLDKGKSCKCQPDSDSGVRGCGIMNTKSSGSYEFHERKNKGMAYGALALIFVGCPVFSYLVWLIWCRQVSQEVSMLLEPWKNEKSLEVTCFTLKIALCSSVPQVRIDTKNGIQRRDYAPNAIAVVINNPTVIT